MNGELKLAAEDLKLADQPASNVGGRIDVLDVDSPTSKIPCSQT